MVSDYPIKLSLVLEYLTSCYLDIRCLTLHTAERLMDHHSRMREGKTLALGTCHKKNRRHGCCHADTYCGHIALDVLHCIIKSETGYH